MNIPGLSWLAPSQTLGGDVSSSSSAAPISRSGWVKVWVKPSSKRSSGNFEVALTGAIMAAERRPVQASTFGLNGDIVKEGMGARLSLTFGLGQSVNLIVLEGIRLRSIFLPWRSASEPC
jgi:hypothetical protein